jgi:hypothetical protein
MYSLPATNFPCSRLRVAQLLIMHEESCRAPRTILRWVTTHSKTRLPYFPKELSLSDLGLRLTKNGFLGLRLSRAPAEYDTTTSVTIRM